MPNPEQLSSFVNWHQKHIAGEEKGEAQIFLDRLFQAFGLAGSLDVDGTSFADYVWKPVVLIEMKKRGENLQRHYRQAFDYWTRSVPNRPRYVVLCNFDEFWIYDFNTDLDTPKDKLATKYLPQRWGPLVFLANQKPVFEIAKVTMMIARKLAIDELHITEQPLPLDNLDNNFIAADALLTAEGLPAQWLKAPQAASHGRPRLRQRPNARSTIIPLYNPGPALPFSRRAW